MTECYRNPQVVFKLFQGNTTLLEKTHVHMYFRASRNQIEPMVQAMNKVTHWPTQLVVRS